MKTVMLRGLLFILLFECGNTILHAQNTLQDYIALAKQNSPLINENKNKSKVSEYELERLRAFYTRPQIGVSANYLMAPIVSTHNNKTKLEINSDGAQKYYGYDLGLTNGGLYQGLVTYSQPLFNNKRYQVFAEQENISNQVNENNTKLTVHDIGKLVTDQYVLCLLDLQQMNFADSMSLLINQQKNIVRKLVNSSILNPSDLALLNIEYENNQSVFATFKSAYRSHLMDLNMLCGINDTTLVMLSPISLDLREKYFASNYFQKYRLDSLNLIAAQAVFETKYKPQVNFFVNGGLNALYAPDIINRFGFSAGLILNWNFYDGHQRSIMQNKTNIQLQTVSFYRENFTTQNDIRKHKLLAELRSYAVRKNIAQIQLDEYDNLLTIYKKEILQAQISIINYVTTLRNMMAVKRDYFLLETNRLLLINAYNYWNW